MSDATDGLKNFADDSDTLSWAQLASARELQPLRGDVRGPGRDAHRLAAMRIELDIQRPAEALHGASVIRVETGMVDLA